MSQSVLFRAAILAGFVAVSTMPVTALAITAQGQSMINNWKGSDRCVAQAQKQFPDFSAEALAKRDQALQQCLTGSALPPRAPQAPTQPHQ